MTDEGTINTAKEVRGNVGSQMRSIYTRREVVHYLLNDLEVETITSLSNWATVAFAVGTFLASQALAIAIAASFASSLTPPGELAVKFGVPTFAFTGAVVLLSGLALTIRKNRIWERIKEDSNELR